MAGKKAWEKWKTFQFRALLIGFGSRHESCGDRLDVEWEITTKSDRSSVRSQQRAAIWWTIVKTVEKRRLKLLHRSAPSGQKCGKNRRIMAEEKFNLDFNIKFRYERQWWWATNSVDGNSETWANFLMGLKQFHRRMPRYTTWHTKTYS